MANRSRSSTAQEDLFPFHETDHAIVLQLVRESACHLAGEERVVLQTIEQIITGVSFGDEPSHLCCDLAELDTFGTSMWTTKEDQTRCVVADRVVLGVFVCVEQGLANQFDFFDPPAVVITYLLDDQSAQTMADEYNLCRSHILFLVRYHFSPRYLDRRTYQLWTPLQVQQIQQCIGMVLDASSRHALRIRDGGIIPIDEDACLGDILREVVPRPEDAVLVRPCFERVVIFASRV